MWEDRAGLENINPEEISGYSLTSTNNTVKLDLYICMMIRLIRLTIEYIQGKSSIWN